MKLWVVLGGFLLMWAGAPGGVSAQVGPDGLDVDVEAVREELAAIQQEILAYRQAGEPVPGDLLNDQRELRRLASGPGSAGRPAARDPLQDAELRAEYAELQAEVRERKAAGVEVPPELQARVATLRRQLQTPRAGGNRKTPRPGVAHQQRLEEQIREIQRETEALAAEGQPIPPQLVAREKAVRRQLNQARRSSRAQGGALAQRQLDGVRRQIERLEDAGTPVPDSLYQRAEALATAADRRQKGGRRATRGDLERELDQLIEQADRFEAEGRPVPDSITRRGRELEQKLAGGNFDDAGRQGRDNGRARAGTDPAKPNRSRTVRGAGGIDPDALKKQLKQVESSLARIEASGAELPTALLRHHQLLQRRLESLGIEVEPEPIAPADDRPETEWDKRQKDENRLRELQNFVASAEERGVPIAESVIRKIESLDQKLFGPAGDEPLESESGPTAAVPDDRREDEGRLAKMYDVAERLEAIGQPIPKNLIQTIERLEQQLSGAAPDPVAAGLEPENLRNGESNPEARLRAVESEFKNLRASGRQPTWGLINELRELRREVGRRRGGSDAAGGNARTRALETRLEGVVTAMRQYEEQGRPVPEQMVNLAEALQKQIEVANRAGAKKAGRQKDVPFDEWPAYVNKQIATRKLDAAGRAEAMKILRQCQTRARPLVDSAAGDPGPAKGAVTVQSTAQRRVNAIFADLKRRVGALGKGSRAKSGQKAVPSSTTRRR